MVTAVMTHLQATAVLQSHQGRQPLSKEQSQAESLLMAGEHTQAKRSACACLCQADLCSPCQGLHRTADGS